MGGRTGYPGGIMYNRLVAVVFALALPACATKPKTGAFEGISQADPAIQSAARFAVQAQNRRQAASLTLVKVLAAEQQVVAGMNYRLTLLVKENGRQRKAMAVVWSQPWRNHLELTEWQWRK